MFELDQLERVQQKLKKNVSNFKFTNISHNCTGCSSVKDKTANQFSIVDCPSVEEAPLVQCIKPYKLLGISPDAAL